MAVNVRFVNVDDFTRKLSAFANKAAPEKFDAIMIKVVSDLLTSVVFLTPVDTGRLRGGWQVGEQIDMASEMPPDPGGRATIDRAMGSITAIRGQGSLIGKTLYLYNNVFYAEYIEFGTEKMAPFAMLRESISIVQATFA